METLYEFAGSMMKQSIEHYFILVNETQNFTHFTKENFKHEYARQMILAGKSLEYRGLTCDECIDAVSRVHAISFDIEKGVSAFVYENSRKYIISLIEKANELSHGFSHISQEDIKTHSYLLPIWQAALNIPSKANLKTVFGSSTDQRISASAATRIADYANDYFEKNKISKLQIIERTERTLEGIVRDLVGRLLFEAIVRDALEKEGIPYLHEDEYNGIEGVVYKFRADFVIPNDREPMAFIEVRKSSSRHASLYAKDKMFSAINWKGKHQKMLGIVVTEGEWTNESLVTMAKVFDYVIPVSKSQELARNIRKYLDGDTSILKWIIDFRIHENS